MAIYHFSMSHISRAAGRSATAAAAYRSAERIHDERTGRTHDYTAKRGVLSSEILAPSRAPDWARDARQLWNAVEITEKRKDSRLARENIVALPHELSTKQNKEWLHRFVEQTYVKRGMVAQVSIHGPDRHGDQRNSHAHIMLAPRQITRNGFKDKKPRVWDDKATLVNWREEYAKHMNRALEVHGHNARVDHRSYKEQGIDQQPTQHMGPAANDVDRNSKETRIGEKNRLAKVFNDNLEAMKKKFLELGKEIEEERKSEKRKAKTQKSKTAMKQPDYPPTEPIRDNSSVPKAKERPLTSAEYLERLDAMRETERTHRLERYALDDQLKNFYRKTDTEAELLKARSELRAANNPWGRLTGRSDNAIQRLRELRLNLKSIETRENEYTGTLNKKQKTEYEKKFGPSSYKAIAKPPASEAKFPSKTKSASEPSKAPRLPKSFLEEVRHAIEGKRQKLFISDCFKDAADPKTDTDSPTNIDWKAKIEKLQKLQRIRGSSRHRGRDEGHSR